MAFSYTATLLDPRDHWPQGRRASRSWYITHPLGGPAGGTFTEVQFVDGIDMDFAEELVRKVAVDLYGNKWAFHYPPEQADDAIFRYNLRKREHVVITELEVW